ncbi:MAG: TldD/PmbA family protein [Calditrichaeota bacterium]|nr:MAG: TldD/PmbA family protein [Calditrichota bacterium]
MKNPDKMDLAQWAVDQTLQAGANEVAVALSNQRQVDVEIREKKLEKLKESTQNSLTLQIYSDHRYSSHTTNDLRKGTLKKFISEAVAATKYLSQDEYRQLTDPKFFPQKIKADLGLLDQEYGSVTTADRVKMAKEIEAAAVGVSDKIISSTAGYTDISSENTSVFSNGFKGESRKTVFYAGAEVTVRDGDSGRPEDWYWGAARFKNKLPAPKFLGEEAARRALRKIGQKKIKSGQFTTIVENRSGGRLLGMFQQPMSARALQQKSSFLDGMLGKKIASDKLTIIDDPLINGGLGSRLFDGEGIAAKKRVMIERGVLNHYYIDNYYGRKLGMQPNSGSASNIVLEYGTRGCDALIKSLENGILITGFIGGNSNSTTGDFSFGIVGLLIEDGKLVQPINEMNISGNAKEFWNKLIEVGNDPYPYSSRQIPSLVFEGVEFSGL